MSTTMFLKARDGSFDVRRKDGAIYIEFNNGINPIADWTLEQREAKEFAMRLLDVLELDSDLWHRVVDALP